MSQKVQLHVYDLSRGMAKTFSLPLLGRRIDAIYHTSIVVYGTEWYFGGGILRDIPFQTPHGQPFEILELGETEIPKELFEEFLSGQTDRFRMDKYHLLENNCNHFTNECSNFLLGVGIPSHIVDLPNEVMSTPFGAMLQPMINNFFSQQGWGNTMGPVNQQQQQQLPTTATTTNTTTTTTTNTTTTIINNNNKVENHPKSNITHRHYKNSNKIQLILNSKSVLFEKSDVEAVFNKLKEFANKEFKGKENEQLLITQYEKESNQLKQIMKSVDVDTPISIETLKYFDGLLSTFSDDHQFPLLEILRMLLLKNQSNQYYTNQSNPIISNILLKIQSKKLSKPSELLSFRVINNCFFSKSGINYLFNGNGNDNNNDNLNIVIESTIDALHSMDKILKRAVSTLAYNLSIHLSIDNSNHQEQAISLLGAIEHILSESDFSNEDPEISFRLLMALGTLIYCNDDLVEILKTLDFDFNKYLNSKELKISQLIKEIQSLLI
ncbi:hypothetical protein DDB_G0292886 [Dictyostelium discoideum AX4]|uniref:PPPDE domain-containing protein n=1 Tax=Dictyostelium discoideum TaxID=44689 RepID=Q54CK2_DICDI|nr:hypothetical protein DDB_G0292886 [Dictyostelium discoideum AX4]EAL60992.1 hypothetical protein DDB_G0292886 [Dictyostelium discoideum AX4]|eukprot:XP_629414.1 hypothetical protein DDB_G0292886 [Dictyostelium discoideum AX4]